MTRRRPEPSSIGPDDPVDRLAGVGPRTAAGLGAVGIRRVADLAFHLPRRYEDRGRVVPVADALALREPVLLHGRLTARSGRYVRRRLHIVDGTLADATGSIAVRWFNQPWIVGRLESEPEGFVFGRVGESRTGRVQLVNPEIELAPGSGAVDEVVAVYPALGPLSGKRLRRALDQALACVDRITDPIPDEVRRRHALPSLAEALRALHRPALPGDREARRKSLAALDGGASPWHRRLAFDELLAVAAVVAGARVRRLEQAAVAIEVTPERQRRAERLLPFRLTDAQRRVVGEIVADLGRPVPMARLLQGDVGCGKTAVAALAIHAALSGGRQAALMAPTELLAEQLHRTVASMLEPAGFPVALLTGSVPPVEARTVRGRLAAGEVGVVVGTHALFQERVSFRDLGLVVIDEQHRFGVAQRQRLLDKGAAPHLLVMTATPIPRSLALTLYGDLDLSVVDELPPGRGRVRTEVRGPGSRPRIFDFLRSEIASGGQCYIVYPLIEASESLAAAALEQHLDGVRQALGSGVAVGVLHGRLDRAEREGVAERFRRGEIQVVLATTVIEVGIDVPAASVMVVESADRFGLSQLHQLRGRVGRGSRRSWCILVTGEEPTAGAERRLEVLAGTTDGFAIAEADLAHRGPGELTGRRQWGVDNLRFADLVRHHELVAWTRDEARRLAASGELDAVREGLLRLHPVGREFAIG